MSCKYVNTQEKMQQILMKKSAKSVYFRTFSRPHLLNYIVSDGPEAACGVGPGGGGGGLRPVYHLRGGGRQLHRPRHLLRGQHHGPGRPPRHQHHGGGEGGGKAGGGKGGQHHQLHPQLHHPGLHHCGASPHQLYPLHHLHYCEEGGGALGQGAAQSCGDGVYIYIYIIMLLIFMTDNIC